MCCCKYSPQKTCLCVALPWNVWCHLYKQLEFFLFLMLPRRRMYLRRINCCSFVLVYNLGRMFLHVCVRECHAPTSVKTACLYSFLPLWWTQQLLLSIFLPLCPPSPLKVVIVRWRRIFFLSWLKGFVHSAVTLDKCRCHMTKTTSPSCNALLLLLNSIKPVLNTFVWLEAMAALTGLDAPLVQGFLVVKPTPEEFNFLDGLDFIVRFWFSDPVSLIFDLSWCYFDILSAIFCCYRIESWDLRRLMVSFYTPFWLFLLLQTCINLPIIVQIFRNKVQKLSNMK